MSKKNELANIEKHASEMALACTTRTLGKNKEVNGLVKSIDMCLKSMESNALNVCHDLHELSKKNVHKDFGYNSFTAFAADLFKISRDTASKYSRVGEHFTKEVIETNSKGKSVKKIEGVYDGFTVSQYCEFLAMLTEKRGSKKSENAEELGVKKLKAAIECGAVSPVMTQRQLRACISVLREYAPEQIAFDTVQRHMETIEMKQAQPEQAQPEQAQPEQAQPEQAQPEQAQPEQAQPEQAQPEQAQPEQAQPEQAQPEQAQPEEVVPDELHPIDKVKRMANILASEYKKTFPKDSVEMFMVFMEEAFTNGYKE